MAHSPWDGGSAQVAFGHRVRFGSSWFGVLGQVSHNFGAGRLGQVAHGSGVRSTVHGPGGLVQ